MSADFAIQPLITFLSLESADWDLIPDKLQTLILKVDDCFRAAQPDARLKERIEDLMTIFLLNKSLEGNPIPFDRLKSINGLGRVQLNFPLILASMQRELNERKNKIAFIAEEERHNLAIEENQKIRGELETLIHSTTSVQEELSASLERSSKIIEELQLKVFELSQAIKSQEAKVAHYKFLPSLQKAAKIGAGAAVSGVVLAAGYCYWPELFKKGVEIAIKMFQSNKGIPTMDPIWQNVAIGSNAIESNMIVPIIWQNAATKYISSKL